MCRRSVVLKCRSTHIYKVVIVLFLVIGIYEKTLAVEAVVPPYKIPSFDGQVHDFKTPVPAIKPAPVVNGDELFQTVVNCFPVRVSWGIEIDTVAGARLSEKDKVSTFDTSGLSRYYVGIVAKMPLFSATEMNRERTEEMQRRGDVSKNIGTLLSALATRNRATRELDLYTSLEARSQKRVALGLTDATEQISFLEKVVKAQSELDSANADIESSRLALVGQCRDDVVNNVNNYLKEIIQLE